LLECENHIFHKKNFLETRNMAWNIEIAEIWSVFFDVYAQFGFKGAHMNAFIHIFLFVYIHIV